MTENATTTSTSVEEQNVVTQGISQAMQQAADAVARVDANLSEITAALRRVSAAVEQTQQASDALKQ